MNTDVEDLHGHTLGVPRDSGSPKLQVDLSLGSSTRQNLEYPSRPPLPTIIVFLQEERDEVNLRCQGGTRWGWARLVRSI